MSAPMDFDISSLVVDDSLDESFDLADVELPGALRADGMLLAKSIARIVARGRSLETGAKEDVSGEQGLLRSIVNSAIGKDLAEKNKMIPPLKGDKDAGIVGRKEALWRADVLVSPRILSVAARVKLLTVDKALDGLPIEETTLRRILTTGKWIAPAIEVSAAPAPAKEDAPENKPENKPENSKKHGKK